MDLGQQKAEIEAHYQTLLQQLKETEEELDQKRSHLEAAQGKLEQEKADLQNAKKELEYQKRECLEMKSQLESEKESLDSVRVKIEENKRYLDEAQKHLESESSENRRLVELLNNEKLSIMNETESLKSLLAEKDKQFEVLQKEYDEQKVYNGELEKKVDSIYQNYTQGMKKIHKLGQTISEKELLLQHYQKQEQDSILIRQENEQAKNIIAALKDTIHKIMQQMEVQADGLNQYAARAIQERETLNASISEQAALRLRNVELINQQSRLETSLEELKAENAYLTEALEQQKEICAKLEQERKITSLEDFTEEQKTKPAVANDELQTCNEAYKKAKELLHQMEECAPTRSDDGEAYWLDDDYSKDGKASTF